MALTSELLALMAQQPDSGSTQSQEAVYDGKRKWRRIWSFRKVYASTILAALEPNEHDPVSGEGYLADFQLDLDAAYGKLSCVYTSESDAGDLSGGRFPSNVPQYFLTWIQDDIPVERLANYKTKWNHLLAAKAGTTTEPDFWAFATDTCVNADNAQKYKWYKDSSQVPDGWYVLKKAEKPGEDRKMNWRATVRQIVWCPTKRDVYSFIRKKVVLKTPPESFGIGGADGYWLAAPSQVSPDGSRWRVENLFILSPEETWDSDLYKVET